MNIFISGITGKVGKLIAAALIVDKSLKLVGGSCSEKNINLGKDIALLLGKQNIGINNQTIVLLTCFPGTLFALLIAELMSKLLDR